MTSISGCFSLISIAFFIADIQHTQEQYSFLRGVSRDPTHCTKKMLPGIFPSLNRLISPPVGPLALIIRSNSREVITSGYVRYPNCGLILGSNTRYLTR